MSLNRHVFAKISKYPFGGKILELTEEEIQQYKAGGYVVEEYADGGESKCPEGMVPDGNGGCTSKDVFSQEAFDDSLFMYNRGEDLYNAVLPFTEGNKRSFSAHKLKIENALESISPTNGGYKGFPGTTNLGNRYDSYMKPQSTYNVFIESSPDGFNWPKSWGENKRDGHSSGNKADPYFTWHMTYPQGSTGKGTGMYQIDRYKEPVMTKEIYDLKPKGTLDPKESINVNLMKQGFATDSKSARAFKKKLWEKVYPDTPYKTKNNGAQNTKLNKWIFANEDKLQGFKETGSLTKRKEGMPETQELEFTPLPTRPLENIETALSTPRTLAEKPKVNTTKRYDKKTGKWIEGSNNRTDYEVAIDKARWESAQKNKYKDGGPINKWGFLDVGKGKNEAVVGAGLNFRSGTGVNAIGVFDKTKNRVFKGVGSFGINQNIGNFNVGAKVDVPILNDYNTGARLPYTFQPSVTAKYKIPLKNNYSGKRLKDGGEPDLTEYWQKGINDSMARLSQYHSSRGKTNKGDVFDEFYYAFPKEHQDYARKAIKDMGLSRMDNNIPVDLEQFQNYLNSAMEKTGIGARASMPLAITTGAPFTAIDYSPAKKHINPYGFEAISVDPLNPKKEDVKEVKSLREYNLKKFPISMANGGEIQEQGGYEYKKDGDKYLTRKKGSKNWTESSGKALASIKYKIYGEGEDPQSPAEKETAIINRMRSSFHAGDDEMFWSVEYDKLSPKEQKIHDYSSQLKSGDITHDPKSAEGKAFEAYAKKIASPEAWMKLMPQTMGQVFDPSNDPDKFKSIKKSWGNVTPEDIETTQDRGSSFDGLTDEDVQFATEQKQYMDNIYADAEARGVQNDEGSRILQNQQRQDARWASGIDPVTGDVMPPWEMAGVSQEQYYKDLKDSGRDAILDYSGIKTLAELSGIAPVARVIDDPNKTWEGVKQTGSDLWAVGEYRAKSDLLGGEPWKDPKFMSNKNPYTGKEYWTGVDETFDALAVAGPLIGALGKSKPFLKKGFNLINEVPSTRVLSKTPLQRLDDVGAWNRYLGNDTQGVRSTIAKHAEKAELRLNLMKENRMLNKQWKASDRGDDIAEKYWGKKRGDVQWEGNDAIRKKYQNFRLKNSGLPIEQTGKGGGQGRIYKNLLDESEYIKLGKFPGTENQLQSLIDVGHDLKKTGNFDNVAFPTKGLTLREGVDFGGNTITTQHMPKLPGSGSYGRGDLKETSSLLRQVRTLDKKGVGIDYTGHNNIMFDPTSKKYQLVDLNYVGPSSNRASNSWSWNKLNLTPKERLAEKFGGKLLDDAADKIKFEDGILQSPEYKSYVKEQALLNQHKYGGEVMDLTDKEIKDYRAKGYTVIID